MAYFAHRIYNIILGDGARPICIKLVEDGLEHAIIQELFYV